MIDDEKNEADGPGEAVLDEPTAHALDPENDPNTEWEQKAVDQVEGSKSADEPKPDGSEDDTEAGDAEASDDSPAEGSEEPS